MLSDTCGAALSVTSQRHTRQGKAPAAVQSSLLVTAAAAAALGCTALLCSLAILGHQVCAAWPRRTGAGAAIALLCPSLDAGEAECQLRIGDEVRLQQGGAPLRFCNRTVIVAFGKRSSSNRTLRLQPGTGAGCLQGCA